MECEAPFFPKEVVTEIINSLPIRERGALRRSFGMVNKVCSTWFSNVQYCNSYSIGIIAFERMEC
jgi:hypothetical protein